MDISENTPNTQNSFDFGGFLLAIDWTRVWNAFISSVSVILPRRMWISWSGSIRDFEVNTFKEISNLFVEQNRERKYL